jgi:hypothetical protein
VERLEHLEELVLVVAARGLADARRLAVLLHRDVVGVQLLERLHRLAAQDRLVHLIFELADGRHRVLLGARTVG